MFSLTRIIIMLVALFAESRVLLRYKDKKLNFFQMIIWTLIWVGLIFIAFFLNYFMKISEILGFYNFLDVIIVLSIIVLFYLYYKQIIVNEELNSQITLLVREIGLLNEKKKENKKTKKKSKK